MSPLEIIVLLHYYCHAEDIANIGAPAIQDAIGRFVAHGLLIRSSNGPTPPLPGDPQYRATEGTAVYVAALQAIPLPVRQWVIPQPGE